MEQGKDTETPNDGYTREEVTFLRRVGHRIATVRAERGYSQRSLAAAAGLNRSYVARIEVGARNPHLLAIRKIAVALEVPVHELLILPGSFQIVARKTKRLD